MEDIMFGKYRWTHGSVEGKKGSLLVSFPFIFAEMSIIYRSSLSVFPLLIALPLSLT
jgi:hypothetical protein